jgi:hypothetical protein
VADWESWAGLVCSAIALIVWAPWYTGVFRMNRLAAPRSYRLVLGLAPIACVLFLLVCIHSSAAKPIRGSARSAVIYVAFGVAALGVSAQLSRLLGVSARDDVLERRNPAALVAIVGAFVGATLFLAGSCAGHELGLEIVIVAAAVTMFTWFFLWCLVELASGQVVSERITVERDSGSAVRLAGLLTANGLVLGAAAAGGWIPDRFPDFALSASPALAFTAVAVVVERLSKSRSTVGRSVMIVAAYVVIAAAWAIHVGLRK